MPLLLCCFLYFFIAWSRLPDIIILYSISEQNKMLVSRTQQLMLGNTATKLGAVFVAALPMVALGGALYAALNQSDPVEGLEKIYSVLFIVPGASLLFGSRFRHFGGEDYRAGVFGLAGVLVCQKNLKVVKIPC